MTPTPDDILATTTIGCGWHRFDGILIAADELNTLLDEAYDPSMPDWPGLIAHDPKIGWYVA